MEGRLAGWMPEGRLQQLTERRQQLAELQQQLRAGSLRGLGACRAALPAAFCPQLLPACSPAPAQHSTHTAAAGTRAVQARHAPALLPLPPARFAGRPPSS